MKFRSLKVFVLSRLKLFESVTSAENAIPAWLVFFSKLNLQVEHSMEYSDVSIDLGDERLELRNRHPSQNPVRFNRILIAF